MTSLLLLQKGLAVEDIIPQRQINTSTVYSHLAEGIALGLLDVRRIMAPDEAWQQRMVQIIEQLGGRSDRWPKPRIRSAGGRVPLRDSEMYAGFLSGLQEIPRENISGSYAWARRAVTAP